MPFPFVMKYAVDSVRHLGDVEVITRNMAEIEKRQAETRKMDETKRDISFGSQIRTYTLQPYRLIKDHRTKFEVGDVDRVLDGDLDPFIRSYLMAKKTKGKLTVQLEDADVA